eukprot:4694654-Prymnesium_polylepis.1
MRRRRRREERGEVVVRNRVGARERVEGRAAHFILVKVARRVQREQHDAERPRVRGEGAVPVGGEYLGGAAGVVGGGRAVEGR